VVDLGSQSGYRKAWDRCHNYLREGLVVWRLYPTPRSFCFNLAAFEKNALDVKRDVSYYWNRKALGSQSAGY